MEKNDLMLWFAGFLAVVIIIFPDSMNPSKLCNSIGMRYQYKADVPGYKMCYGIDQSGNMKYAEVPKVK